MFECVAKRKSYGSVFVRRIFSCMLVPLILLLLFRRFCLPVCADTQEKSVEEVMLEGFYSFSESIDISEYRLTSEELARIFTYIIKDDPYLFHVDGKLSFSYHRDGYVLKLMPSYLMSEQEAYVAWEYCRTQVRLLVDTLEGSALQKAILLHDYICNIFSYDDALKNQNIYAFLQTGRGTCQAYTQLYIAFLREAGIESHFVASDSIAHIWNLVKIDGIWYHVDLTWDDSVLQERISRRHLLLSDKTAFERGHRDWYSPIEDACASEIYRDADFDTILHGEIQAGDVDHNGKIELPDLLILRRFLLNEREVDLCRFCTDLDRDGLVDGSDVILLRRKLLQGN